MSMLSEPLQRLIHSGTLDLESAQKVEQFRLRTGMGLVESLAAMGIAVGSAHFVEKQSDSEMTSSGSPLGFMQMALDPNLTFDSFLRCEKNELAVNIARSLVLDKPLFPFCLVHAPVAMGKTHLLSAVAAECHSRSFLFMHTSDLAMVWQSAFASGNEMAFRQALVKPDLLLLDDLDWCRHSVSFQEELCIVISHRIAQRKTMFVSTAFHPSRIPGLEENLYSLLDGAVTTTLGMGDVHFRKQLLLALPHARKLPEEVLDYLALAVTDNYRKLKGATAQLFVMASYTKLPMTVDVARAVVPMPEDLSIDPQLKAEEALNNRRKQKADQLRGMLLEAETMEEQCLALQITISESIQLLRAENLMHPQLVLLEKAFLLVHEKKFEEALKTCAGFFHPVTRRPEDA